MRPRRKCTGFARTSSWTRGNSDRETSRSTGSRFRAGVSEELRSHEEAEQVYVVVSGTGTMSATGDTQRLEVGDLVLIPPATDHAVANDGEQPLALVSVQSPAVSADELYSRRLATQAAGYDDYGDE